MEYLEKYFATAKLILHQDYNCLSRIRLIEFSILFRGFYYGIFIFIPINNLQMIAFFDEAYSFGVHRSTYQFIALINCLLSLYFFENIYVNPSSFIIDFLKGILFKSTCKFFPNASSKVFKSIQNFAKIMTILTQGYIVIIGK